MTAADQIVRNVKKVACQWGRPHMMGPSTYAQRSGRVDSSGRAIVGGSGNCRVEVRETHLEIRALRQRLRIVARAAGDADDRRQNRELSGRRRLGRSRRFQEKTAHRGVQSGKNGGSMIKPSIHAAVESTHHGSPSNRALFRPLPPARQIAPSPEPGGAAFARSVSLLCAVSARPPRKGGRFVTPWWKP